jgi:flagellar protein FlaG
MSLNQITGTAQATTFSTLPAARGSVAIDSNTPASTPPVENKEVAAAKQVTAPSASVKDDALDKAVSDINKFLKPINSSIEFSIDQESGRTLVKVIDTDTKDVLRQFPSKEALAISQELGKLQGLLVREKA